MRPGAINGAAVLGHLPDWATVREIAPCLSHAEALMVAESILDDIKAGRITRPYTPAIRHSLHVCAAVFAREETSP